MFGRIAFRQTKVTQVLNRMKFSSIPPAGSQQEARAARKARLAAAAPKNAGKFSTVALISLASIAGIVLSAAEISYHPKGALAQLYEGSMLQKALNYAYRNTIGRADAIFEPASDKLMPDWPTAKIYENVPPGTPCPPLLIVDLERTLVGSVHDVQYGWRHVKRPGLDRFIKSLAQYYEVVIFSENDIGLAQEIMDAIDPENMTHRMGNAAAEIRGTKVLKRLDYMNRDPRRILVIDDNPESVELCMDNALIIKPFMDVNSKTDKELENLIPLLQAFVHDNVQDFPRALRDLGTHDADEAVAEYRMRLAEVKQAEQRKRNRGLGGLIRGASSASSEDDGFVQRSSVLSPSDIVGSSAAEVAYNTNLMANAEKRDLSKNYFHKDKPKPSEVKKKGKLMDMLEQAEAKKAEEDAIKNNMMNELYQKRMMAKARAKEMEQEQ
jgi:import inner membrane translocase subunit TIM50